MENNKQLIFSLNKIVTEEFAIIEQSYKGDDVDKEFEISVAFEFNAEKYLIAVFCEYSFLQNNAPFLLIKMSCHFKIDNETWSGFLDENKTSVIIDKLFLRHLAGFTVGTLRGALHSKTENTPFNKFHVPPIVITELVPDDITLSL